MIETITIVPEICECGRLYKDRRDEHGKMMCSSCLTGLSVEDLAKLWGTPTKETLWKSSTSGFRCSSKTAVFRKA